MTSIYFIAGVITIFAMSFVLLVIEHWKTAVITASVIFGLYILFWG